MYANNSKEFIQEKQKIENVLRVVEENLKDLDIRRKHVWENCTDPIVTSQIAKILEDSYRNLLRAKTSPYFARIDFKEENGMEGIKQIYIGKSSVMDDCEIIVVDWRAPISSMYYQCELGKASYDCPEGKIVGDLLLKRQYTIEDGKLISFDDIDLCTNDALLQKSLSSSSDVRLKNIVATIQAEQNRVIREKLNKTLIVQGVAGSGKTTVALHRIAYLVYTYQKKIKPEEFLIIAPNKFFLDYISDTLPDLGVDNIEQKTYEDFALEIIGGNVSVASSNEILSSIVDNDKNAIYWECVSKFKISLIFKRIVEQYIKSFETDLMTKAENGFCIEDILLANKSQILKSFYEHREDISIKERIGRLKNYLLQCINGKISNYENSFGGDRVSYSQYAILRDLGKKRLNQFINTLKLPNVVELYGKLLSNTVAFDGILDEVVTLRMQKDFLKAKKSKQVQYEDLPALLLLYCKVFGIPKDSIPQYVIIDEAQDLSDFQFCLFKEDLKVFAMTILGDIAQGIYSYRGITDWEAINKSVFDGDADVVTLSKSYRTSIEVMNEANKVASKLQQQLNIQLAQPLVRHGESVSYFCENDIESEDSNIVSRIGVLREKGYNNIALISKKTGRVRELYEKVKAAYNDANIIEDTTAKYVPGINVLSAQLSKGLEFEAVILADVEKDIYSESVMDGKLLYIAMTRAMHSLDIFYVGKISNFLK